jgi:hypothetical protein
MKTAALFIALFLSLSGALWASGCGMTFSDPMTTEDFDDAVKLSR